MASWTKEMFEHEATRIAQLAIEKKGSLHELTVATAKLAKLNDEQIRRLARAVNSKAFNAYFEQRKTAEDRFVSFDCVDPEKVITELSASKAAPYVESEREKKASYPDLPNEVVPARTPPKQPIEKTAEVMARAVGPEEPPHKALIHWKAACDRLASDHRQLQIRWATGMDKLANKCRRLYWDHDSFEKHAVALYGSAVLPELQALRERLNMAPFNMEKEAADQIEATVFGVERPEHVMLKHLIETRQKADKTAAALKLAMKYKNETQQRVDALFKDAIRKTQ
jgi:hypothetical protein